MSENVNVDLLKHQLCRAFRNLRVANEVVIQRDGEHGGLKIIPKYADVKVVDAEEIIAGLLAGRLHTANIDTSEDEAFLATVPKDVIDRLWAEILDTVKPIVDRITDKELHYMSIALEKRGAIRLRLPSYH
jgi:DNA-binding IscR family transcriptional regulator